MLLRLIPHKTDVKFLKLRFVSLGLSGFLFIASLGLFLVEGLNYGIDFVGGTLIEIGTDGPADIDGIRSVMGDLGLGDVQVQTFGAPDDVLIRFEQQPGEGREGELAQQQAREAALAALNENFPGVVERRVEVVGGTVSQELVEASFVAVLAAVLMVLIYIWFRFEWQFAAGAVLALVHDVVLTIGVFSLLRFEFNLPIIAALLTIVGYSLNDTVVVYDRVRENLRKYKRMPLPDLLDLSINDTLTRTMMTSLTTLLALFSLYIFGGEVIRGFTFAMIWGVVVGTYSSIFIASPFLLIFGVKRDWSKNIETDAEAAARL